MKCLLKVLKCNGPRSGSNCSGLPGFGPGWNSTESPGQGYEPLSNPNWVSSAGSFTGLDRNPQFFGWVETGL